MERLYSTKQDEMSRAAPIAHSLEDPQTSFFVNNEDSQLRLLSYNIHGHKSIINMQSDELNDLTQNHIIVLVETWLIKTNTIGISELTNLTPSFHMSIVHATESKKGRASGGIIILTKECVLEHRCTVVETKWNISVRLRHKKSNRYILLTAVYFNDSLDSTATTCFKNHIQSMASDFPSDMMMIVGDFNARVGLAGQIDKDVC